MATYDPTQSHDQNFKTIIVENPWDAITFAIPKCADFFTHKPEIEPIREETVKTFFTESFTRMDVPLLAKYENLAFTFLIEHHHNQYSFSIHQLSRYVSHLEEQYERDVIPIVYFPNASGKNAPIARKTISAFMGKRYHYFTYEAVFLRDFWAKRFLTSRNLMARLLLPFMRFSKDDWLEVVDGAIEGVFELVDPTQGLRRSKYLDFVLHYFNLDQPQWETYQAYKEKQKEGEVVEMINTILKKQGWEEGFSEGKAAGLTEGKAEGKVEGKVEGKAEGEKEGFLKGEIAEGRDLLLLLLPKRLGPVPPPIERAIRSLEDIDRVHAILTRFMELQDWREIEQLLNGNLGNA